jgi:hypothetical protein
MGVNEGIKYVLGIEGTWADHFRHRLDPWTVAKEVVDHVAHKTLPQGADEVANVLFSGSAYLPWPAHGGPKPIPTPEAEPTPPEPDNFDNIAALYGVAYGPDRGNGMER